MENILRLFSSVYEGVMVEQDGLNEDFAMVVPSSLPKPGISDKGISIFT